MYQGRAPIYTARGARPRPTPAEPDSHAWRGPGLLALVMLGWLIFIVTLAAIFAPAGAGSGGSIQIGSGVRVTSPGGWTPSDTVWPVGPNPVSIQKAGVLVTFAAASYGGSTQNLADDRSTWLGTQFASYRALPTASTTIAGDLPALVILFSGSANSGLLEGELVVATRGGTGVAILAVAPSGQLSHVQGDLDSMLNSMVVP